MFSKDWTTHRTVALGVLALAFACAAPAVDAQVKDPPYQMLLSDTLAAITEETVTIDLSFTLIDVDVRGWSIAVCHPGDIVEPSLIEASETVNTSNDGGEPFFSATRIVAGEAFTIGTLVSSGSDVVGPGTDIEAYTITYDLLAVGDASLTFCSAGDPPVVSFFAIGGGPDDDIRPVVSPGRIIVEKAPPPFEFTLAIPNPVRYRPENGDADFTVTVRVREIEENSLGFPTDTRSLSLDLSYDKDLVDATDVVAVGVLADLRDGLGPQFFGRDLEASGTAVTALILYSFATETLAFEEATDVIEISFSVDAGVLEDDLDGETMQLVWSDEFGAVPVRNFVLVPGEVEGDPDIEADVITVNGTVVFEPAIDVPFIRGDCNDDRNVNIADGIYLLSFRFGGGPKGPCEAACDISGDGTEDSVDAIYLFNHQFLEGPEPPAPFPDCGLLEDAPCATSACED